MAWVFVGVRPSYDVEIKQDRAERSFARIDGRARHGCTEKD